MVDVDKEEQIIQLKSEVEIYKTKARDYKTKLKFELDQFKKNALQQEKNSCFKDLARMEVEVNELKRTIESKNSKINDFGEQATAYRDKIAKMDEEFQEIITAKETELASAKDKILRITSDFKKRLSHEKQRHEQERMSLELEGREENMKKIRLEFFISNQRKMSMQQKYLEQQLDKDLKQLQITLNKAEMDLKRDQLVPSGSAIARLQDLHQFMTSSLMYTKRLVSFMVFEQEGDRMGSAISSLDEEASMAQIQEMMDDEEQHSKQSSASPSVSPKRSKASRPGNAGNTGAQDWAKQQNFGNNFSNSASQIPIDRLVKLYNFELLEVLINMTIDNFKMSGTPITIQLTQTLDLVQEKTEARKVQEIRRQFLSDGKIHFQQYILKMSEKIQNLQTERQMLQNEQRELRVELNEQFDKFNDLAAQQQQFVKPTIMIPEEEPAFNPEGEKKVASEQVSEIEGAVRASEVLSNKRSSNIASEKDQAGRDKRETIKHDLPLTKQSLIFLQRENLALRERTKEVRLILNRKMDELQQVLKATKQSHEHELAQLKAECKKDLDILRQQELKTHDMLKQQIYREAQQESQQLKDNFAVEKEELEEKYNESMTEISQQLADETKQKEAYYIELQRRKGETNNMYEGGLGTFTLAFENPYYQQLLQKQAQLQHHRQMTDVLKASLKGKKKKKRSSILQQEEIEHELTKEIDSLANLLENMTVQPHETLNHFIEVGFQISQTNFQHLQVYNEQTYDSMTRKYAYEFQFSLDELSVIQLENKLRHQISQNFALFNEICPVYISLNMGRPVKDADEITKHPIEKFRIIDRKSSMVTDQFLTINFLKSDLPFTLIRIVAFNNATCDTFQLDLTRDDLMILVNGHQRLLEEENQADLCSLLLNQLTMLERNPDSHDREANDGSALSRSDKQGKRPNKKVLVVEHRCFFNNIEHKKWDSRNKLIIARHDKRKQGLLTDVETITDFDKSIVYEAFFDVYVGEAVLPLQEIGQADHFDVILQQGSASGHLKLVVKLKYTDIEQNLCLFNSDMQSKGQSMNLAAALIHPPKSAEFQIQDKYSALAYVISIEKMMGRDDVIIVRLASIQRRFSTDMGEFIWRPDLSPNMSSTDCSCEVLYLVKKIGEPFAYTKVSEFEIFNTEARAQLFSHAFGFKQKSLDFGIDFETRSHLRSEPLSAPAITADEDYSHQPVENPQFRLARPAELEPYLGNEVFLLRDFIMVRIRKEETSTEQMATHADDDSPHGVRQYAMITLMYIETQLLRGLINVHVNLPELDQEFTSTASVLKLIPLSEIEDIKDKDMRVELCNRLFEKLVICQEIDGSMKLHFDETIETITEELRVQRQKKFDEQVVQNNSEEVKLQIPDPMTLEIERSQLQDCEKVSQISLIGQRSFKVTCYFVNFLRTFKKVKDAMFDWQVIYVEAYLSNLDVNLVLVISERDLVQLMCLLKETTQSQDMNNIKIDTSQLLHKSMTNQQLMNLVLDVVTLSQSEQLSLAVSFNHFQRRVKERNIITNNFQETGGRYVRSFKHIEDPEMKDFTTSVYQSEITRKLILNVEKDFSDSKVDIKIYETRLQSRSEWRKLQVEIFQVEDPSIIFRCDYFSTSKQNGRQLIIERFNLCKEEASLRLEQETNDEQEKEKIRQKGMIFSLTETSFPHQFNFMLLEPCSHIFWHYEHSDNKLNLMERRADKQAFAQILLDSMTEGIFRDVTPQTSRGVDEGYQQIKDQASKKYDGKVQVLLPKASFEKNWVSNKQNELNLVYGLTLEQSPNVFRDVKIFFNQNARKFIITSSILKGTEEEKTKEMQRMQARVSSQTSLNSKASKEIKNKKASYEPSEIELQFLLINRKEGFRYFQGVLEQGKNPLIFQVEQACAFSSKEERAIRIQIKRILGEDEIELIFDLIMSERDLFVEEKTANKFMKSEKLPEVKQDKKTEIMFAYRESLSSLPKMDDLALDLTTCEAQKIADIPLLKEKTTEWEMIYRKMMTDDLTNGRFVVTLLRKNLEEGAKDRHNVKLTLFEIESGKQDMFIFTEYDVLDQEALAELAKGRSDPKMIFKKAIDARLKIKHLVNPLFGPEQKNEDSKMMAFFINPALLDLPKPRERVSNSRTNSQGSFNRRASSIGSRTKDLAPEKAADDPIEQLFADISNFDIRKGVCSNLMNPDPDLNEVGSASYQRSLVGQYERNNLYFDVYQDLDPYEVRVRINAFDKENYRLLSSANLAGEELRNYLKTDQKTFLLEGQQREELGKYLVENILVDATNKKILLLKSQMQENEVAE